MTQLKAQSWSVMGSRHQTNDDSVVLNPEKGIFIVCDGVSEGGRGKFASQLVSLKIQERLAECQNQIRVNGAKLLGTKRLQAMNEMVISVFSEAQIALSDAAAKVEGNASASTTCTALWLDGRFGILAHLGDTRAYLNRAGKIYQLTRDHTGLDELIAMGMPVATATQHPLAKSLSKALGNVRYQPPDILKIEFQPGDSILLSSDGIHGSFDQASLQTFFQGAQNPKTNLGEWVETCAHRGGDDASMVIIQFPTDWYRDVPLQADARIKLIQETPLCKYLDYVQRSHIAAICELEQFQKGSLIVQEETDGDTMYIIANGTLSAKRAGQHLTYMKPGEFFGEIALIQDGKRKATVIADEDTLLLSLKRHDLFEVFKKDLLMEKNFYRAMLESTLSRLTQQGQELAKMKSV